MNELLQARARAESRAILKPPSIEPWCTGSVLARWLDRSSSPLQALQPRRLRAARSLAHHRQRRVSVPHRAERRRQVDVAAAAAARGAAERRRSEGRRAATCATLSAVAGPELSPDDRLRLPGLPADPALHRVPERRVRHARARRAVGRAAAQDVSGAQVGRPPAPDERAARRSCRAASSSASRSRARSSTIRSSCSPTSRPAISIPICRSRS